MQGGGRVGLCRVGAGWSRVGAADEIVQGGGRVGPERGQSGAGNVCSEWCRVGSWWGRDGRQDRKGARAATVLDWAPEEARHGLMAKGQERVQGQQQ